jgi:hypothetical protein
MASGKDSSSLGSVGKKLLEDALQQIVHEIVAQAHTEHKELLLSLNPKTKLPHCDTCTLPRLLDPPLVPKVRGAAADPPSNTNYCDRKPWARKVGHDIYGNPFLKSDVTGRPLTKKEREAKKKEDGTPASEDQNNDGTGPPSPNGEGDDEKKGPSQKLEKGEKKASKIDEKLRKGEYVPWHTCPSCKRSLLITRFAKHLEQCMGLSGRAASRNAMAKMNGTPTGSRGGTPNPSQDGGTGKENNPGGGGGGGETEDDDLAVKGPGGVRKKLLKKGLKEKVKKDKTAANGKLPKSLTAHQRPSLKGDAARDALRSSPAPSSLAGGGGDGGKRDRDELGDDDEDELHLKKRQKLQRVGSTTSLVSQSTAPEMERTESQDGSFVDGSVVDD